MKNHTEQELIQIVGERFNDQFNANEFAKKGRSLSEYKNFLVKNRKEKLK